MLIDVCCRAPPRDNTVGGIFRRVNMGVNHGGTGGRIPQNLQWGTLIQVVPQIFVFFSKF
jgi:hypothetical protein